MFSVINYLMILFLIISLIMIANIHKPRAYVTIFPIMLILGVVLMILMGINIAYYL